MSNYVDIRITTDDVIIEYVPFKIKKPHYKIVERELYQQMIDWFPTKTPQLKKEINIMAKLILRKIIKDTSKLMLTAEFDPASEYIYCPPV